ncbi:phosphoglycerate mutase-like protein [Fistulina hepatica ATCC 64428]|uniref:Phosphoglycerate mutase-like protein n=1 Tax=Fistulina hepatica ATCC 64428 TaxID=1128425 RepID=A0A0D7ADS4_9AGAR|nr:phosphoglycerate mutase-like protein [Fistulina hepatica ATCC 64428]
MKVQNIIGAVVLARHGDRQGFYQDPTTYAASNAVITPLGNQQEYQLGELLRSLYLDTSSSTYIPGISTDLVNVSQIQVRADAGGEGGVIFSSAVSLLQGLYPPTTEYQTTLANGTTIIASPLIRSLAVESVEPDNDISLESWTDCGTFSNATTAFYNSAEFAAKKVSNEAFLDELPSYLDGRNVSLENMWNIYDYMNVEYIHNATFADNLPITFLPQARDLANWHEMGVFTSPSIDGIGNIAGRTVLPTILDAFQQIVAGEDGLKLVYVAISYKPFLSLFNMTGVFEMNPEIEGIVNYAAAVVFELYNSTSGTEIRFKFKNGTDDPGFSIYRMLGSYDDVSLTTFIDTLAPTSINSTLDWCKICSNHDDCGCSELNPVASTLDTTVLATSDASEGHLSSWAHFLEP